LHKLITSSLKAASAVPEDFTDGQDYDGRYAQPENEQYQDEQYAFHRKSPFLICYQFMRLALRSKFGIPPISPLGNSPQKNTLIEQNLVPTPHG
jgi:hypothetical protein